MTNQIILIPFQTKLTMKSKGKVVYLDICDKIIIRVLDIQRQNHHLRNSKRTSSDHDVRLLLDNEIASSKSSMELEQSAMKSLRYSSNNTSNEEANTSALSDQQIPEIVMKASNFEPSQVKSEPLCEEEVNSYRFDTNNSTDNESDPHVQQKTDDLEEQSEDEMRKKYLKLQIRNLQIVNYKEMLQIVKLERELGIARSELPRSYHFNM